MPLLFRKTQRIVSLALCLTFVPLLGRVVLAQAGVPTVDVDWSKTAGAAHTVLTLQVVENPPLRRGSPIHDAAWANLAALHTDMTRLALWYPYPRLAVAELAPPTRTATSWDFTAIDPIVGDFYAATAGHSSVFTMSTIPTWMFCDSQKDVLPISPDVAVWGYESGTTLCDATGQQVAEYYGRVAAWYSRGSFTDELGVRHTAAGDNRMRHQQIAWWEVLNEPEYEHALDVQTYTRLYDGITAQVHAVSPATRFVGMSLAEPMRSPDAFEYFLNPAHHAPGTPLDAVSFHFYADAQAGETDATQEFSFYAQAEAFLNSVRYIKAIRNRLSPHTQLHINEVGCITGPDLNREPDKTPPAPDSPYWNLCGSVLAYLYIGATAEGVDVLGASQLVGYPTQFPSVSLLDWTNGSPNPRYRVLKLLHDHFRPDDILASATTKAQGIAVAAYASAHRRQVLLVNERSFAQGLQLRGCPEAREEHIDLETRGAVAHSTLNNDSVELKGYSVMVLTCAATPRVTLSPVATVPGR